MVGSEAAQIIEGGLLSDVSIFQYRKGLRMSLAQTGAEHLDWVRSMAIACLSVGITAHYKVYDGDKYPKGYVYMWTRNHPILWEMYGRWYASGGKRVPAGLVLSPIVLANWFMGDGSSTYRKEYGEKYVIAKFSTQGFDTESIDLLVSKLAGVGIAAARNKCGRYWAIYASSFNSVSTLMNLIELHMLPSYRYKLKRPSW